MNAEKLHAITAAVLADLQSTRIVDSLPQLAAALQTLVNAPQDTNSQITVGSLRTQIASSLATSAINFFPPTWSQVLEEMKIDRLLGNSLATKIEDAFLGNEITPAVSKAEIDSIIRELDQLRNTLASLTGSLSNLGIGSETLARGECELAVLIPRIVVDDSLKQLGSEFEKLQRIFAPFAELATGSRPEFKVRTISSSDFSVYLELQPLIAVLVAHGIERIIALYKSLLEIRKLQGELKAQGVPKSALKGLDEHANDHMQKGIGTLVDEIMQQFSDDIENGRKNELKVELTYSLNGIATRIDLGYNLDVRAATIDESGEGNDEIQKEKAAIESIQAVSPNLKFMHLEGERILSLPESQEEATTKR